MKKSIISFERKSTLLLLSRGLICFCFIIIYGEVSLAAGNAVLRKDAASAESRLQQPSKIKIQGKVLDDQGDELPGATVMVKGTTTGTAAGINGEYEIEVQADAKTLVFSFMGMVSKEIALKGQSTINVTLASASHVIDEVVVTGMGVVDKRLHTGATTKLDAEKVKLDGIADVSKALDGRVAGVSVQSVSGTFGTASKIRVRGATSILGSSKPLWVVDGVVMEDVVEVSADQLSSGDAVTLISSAISGLNADDIESFQILKDGASTSIYGARAMAGVIVVTTKKGQAGKSRINYTGEFSTRLKPSYSNFNISNSQEQMGIYSEMEQKGWLEFASIANASSSGVYGKMYDLIDLYDKSSGTYGLKHDETSMNAYLRQAEYRNTDWFDLLFQNSLTQNHAVSISTGTEKARFYASLSVMNDPGWTLSSGVERYTANANASFDISKDVTINLLTNGSYRAQKAPGTLSRETDVVRGQIKRNFDINPYSYAMNASRTLDPNEYYTRNYSAFNIFHELENNYIDLNVSDLKFQGELNWKPLKGWTVNALAAIRYQSSTQEHFIKSSSNQALAYRAGIDPEDATIRDLNPYLYTDPEDANALPETVLPKGGIYFRSDFSLRQVDFRATTSYNHALGASQQHIFSLFAGAESNLTDRNRVYFQGWGYEDGGAAFVDYKLFKQQGEENSVYYTNNWTYARSLAGFASGTYSYEGLYVMNLTGRYEGTNKLGRSRQARWLPTYNISGAWNMHQEAFFSALKPLLSHMTLKTSYSLTADRGPADVTNADPIYRSQKSWRPLLSVSEVGLNLEDIANSELTYEKKYEFNAGLEAGLLRNRINIALDGYWRNNFDLIGLIYTQGVGGITAKYANVAGMSSHGIETTLSTKNVTTKSFNWTTDFTFSWATNKITELDARSNVLQLISGVGYASKGYPVRALFSIPFVGLNDEGLPVFINQEGEETVTDINFQEFEKMDFLQYEGPSDPTITGGLGNIFTYKAFRLNVFLTYSFGNKVRLDPVFSAAYSDMDASPKEFKNRWTLPGDQAYTSIPVIAGKRQYYNDTQLEYAYSAYNYSTERIADGGFVRLKEVSLSYDFPAQWIAPYKITNFQLKIQATNLMLLYADKKLNGQDPEFMNSGGVAVPMPKQFTLTVRLGL